MKKYQIKYSSLLVVNGVSYAWDQRGMDSFSVESFSLEDAMAKVNAEALTSWEVDQFGWRLDSDVWVLGVFNDTTYDSWSEVCRVVRSLD